MQGARAPVAVIVAAAVLVLAGSTAAANPDFDRGVKLLDNLEYKAAAEAFQKALERGDNDPATTAKIYLRLGEIAASTGDEKEAIERFRRALSIDLTIKLAAGTSPKVGKPFADARRGIDDPIAASIAVDKGEKVAATLEVANDGLKMVRSAAVTYIVGDDKTSAGIKVKGAKTPIPLPAGATALEVALLDRYDNRVIELERVTLAEDETPPPDITPPPPVVTKTNKSGSFITRWYLWGGLAVAAAATGVAFGLSTQSTLDDLDELKLNSTTVEGSEALALEDKARSRALWANISFAAAGALAITAGVFFFTADDAEQEAGDVAFTPTLSPDGVGVVSTLRW